jgi:hypothetical protein
MTLLPGKCILQGFFTKSDKRIILAKPNYFGSLSVELSLTTQFFLAKTVCEIKESNVKAIKASLCMYDNVVIHYFIFRKTM